MKWRGLLLSAMVSLTQAGCRNVDQGISVEADQPIPPVAVNIVESSVVVEVTKTFQFHFNVVNTTYPTCTWTVNGVAGGNSALGTITSEGLYTAPARIPTPNTVIVKATATADPTKSDSATVTIGPGFTKASSDAVVNLSVSRPFSGNIAVTQPETADPRNPSP